uniref:PHD finger protein 20, a n=1 Tax=Neogobius melanostomus TaxID=47308 RepID=A0A8C6UEZ9_9GOBI
MSKTPPNRRGITLRTGESWYIANIEKIDYEDEKVLIHYRQWSHRYDEWFEWTSPYLRPVERVQLRRQGRHDDGFHINDKVLASWSDCRFYPAKVTSVNKDGSYTVKFYDGVVQTVKGIHVKPFIKEVKRMARRGPNRRDRRSQENGGPKFKRARRSTSDQEEDSTEDDEHEEEMKTNGEMESSPSHGVEEVSDKFKVTGLTNGVKTEGDDVCHLNEVRSNEGHAEHGTKPYSDFSKPYSDSNQMSKQTEQDSITMTTTQTNGDVDKRPVGQSESTQHAVDVPPPQTVKRECAHFENLFSIIVYLMLENPPPVLSINLDHNPFKCTTPGCTKSFRKAKLLHYHMKYYHGEEQPLETVRSVHTRAAEKQASVFDGPKRRRTISATMHPVKDKFREKPKQKDFLRIKLKKRKKKKKAMSGRKAFSALSLLLSVHCMCIYLKTFDAFLVVDEDSFSDWSTDSCGWSDEDFGDLDVTTPPLSIDSGAVDTSDQEIVRCICEVEEENDFMIQCEECLCWQHGTCMGLLEDNVPDRYTCYICRDPPGQRQSQRYWYERDWLSNGHMFGLSFLEENYSHQNAKKITSTHQLLGDVHHVVEILNGLQLKMSVLQNNAHPELQLWRLPWKQAERARFHTDSDSCRGKEDMSRGEILLSNALEKLSRAAATSSSSCSSSPFPSFQDSYITSEHCYQKPRAYYPAVEQRLVVETRQASEVEDNRRSTEELLEREQRYGNLSESDKPKSTSSKIKEEKDETCTEEHHQQWQLNLLDHIDAVQDEVSFRMDFIERELDVLESWLDFTGELEPPEPLARLPQLKHRIKRLLTQLGKVQQISLYSAT